MPAGIRDSDGSAVYLRLDVTDEAEWRAAVERVLGEHGGLDVLVNDAGVGDLATIEKRGSPAPCAQRAR